MCGLMGAKGHVTCYYSASKLSVHTPTASKLRKVHTPIDGKQRNINSASVWQQDNLQ